MTVILRRRRVGLKIYRINFKTMNFTDDVERKCDIGEVELRRWLKFDSWSLREAAQLSCGQRPKQTSHTYAVGRTTKKSAGSPGVVARKSGSKELDEMTDLIRRARNAGTFGDPVKPAVFIEWLRAKHPETNLVRIVDEDSIQRGTTSTAIPNQALSPNHKAAEANKLHISHKILLALAMKYTKYDDKDNKKSIDSVMKAISDCGLEIGRDTVKKHLSKAYGDNIDKLKESVIFDRKRQS